MVLSGGSIRPWPIGAAFLLTIGTYLLDRVGPWPAIPDRADVMSVPERVRFLRRRVPRVRLLAGVVLAAAVTLLLAREPLLALLVPASVLGLVVYAHTPDGWRLKDRLLVKNVAVAASMTAMAVVLVWLVDRPPPAQAALAVIPVFLTATAAAVLCDLDDAAADARRGTRTLPNVFGPAAAWWAAGFLIVAAAAVLVVLACLGVMPWRAAGPMAAAPAVVVGLLLAFRPRRVRDLVDVAFPLAMLCAAMLSGSDAVLGSREDSPQVRAVPPEHQQGNHH
jgi:4-hydroxybenzoate polyprenyltransferase